MKTWRCVEVQWILGKLSSTSPLAVQLLEEAAQSEDEQVRS